MEVFWLDGFLYCVVQWLYPSPKPTVFNDGHRALGEVFAKPLCLHHLDFHQYC